MSEVIREFDDRGNCIYLKSYCVEEWGEYDEFNNCIHVKSSDGLECWLEFDEYGRMVHYRYNDGKRIEFFMYNDKGDRVKITQAEFEQIKKDKAINNFYLNNSKVSRFELIDI